MPFEIRKERKFKYVDVGEGEVLLLLHGLFGAMSNFKDLMQEFKDRYRIVLPLLPLFELPFTRANLPGLVKHIQRFVEYRGLDAFSLVGNSLGGHIALMYALEHLDRVQSITLTGSSGLFEHSLGDTFPKRGNYEYVKEKTELTFYDPKVATKELVDEVFSIVNDRSKALNVIATAKSAIRNNLREHLHKIDVPVLLIWGKQDTITPPFVGEEFQRHLPNATLKFIDKCGHAPMMERPHEFNVLLDEFLQGIYVTA
jgi:pimeloyl-ACP methyl ester carboxylesterase